MQLVMNDILPVELIKLIFSHIDAGGAYKAARLTCRGWYNTITTDGQLHEMRNTLCNHLLTLRKMYPNGDWDYTILSENPALTWKHVEEHIGQEWCWDTLSMNKSITWDIIRNNPAQPWNLEYFAQNPNLAWEHVCVHPFGWDWNAVSRHQCVTWDIINRPVKYPWDWTGVSYNPNITWCHIRESITKGEHRWRWRGLSSRADITCDILREFRDSWDMTVLSKNQHITWDIVLHNLDMSWDWDYVAANPCVMWGFLKRCPGESWEEFLIEKGPRGREYAAYICSAWEDLSSMDIFTWDEVVSYISTEGCDKWDWTYLTCNKICTMEIIKNNPQYPWDLHFIAGNPNATWEIISNSGNIDYIGLSDNNFGKK